ncbi:PTS system mannose-specific IIA component [Cryobacterium mesophilum]|uniref:PTS sugar transporter subunit IIA n=1 Tax=Terrimesophilobacter mesophilus TaxID=433647 RepID=A0A4R8VBQ3_9MICO|nr:PTS sugar transporter subunit IIA [Terrimesophilobacter mesophilus]MBB5633343.1 PTS system mannose-specific IIA component [Terrimesophilobacter mesophilus]TFB80075.1 PTS sugar transporter subunit IIA [Terrimesophilobacter mesophilus]
MKILVAGHGALPEALVSSARMIGGELPGVASIGLFPGDTPQDLRDRMLQLLADFPADLILTDLAGGTPDNVASLVAKGGQVASIRLIVAGASLPLLLEFALSGTGIEELDSDDVISETGAIVRFRAPVD